MAVSPPNPKKTEGVEREGWSRSEDEMHSGLEPEGEEYHQAVQHAVRSALGEVRGQKLGFQCSLDRRDLNNAKRDHSS